MMRVLVTGGAGFIGSHVLTRLLAEGHTLCVVDNLSAGRTENVPRAVPLHMADITDPHVADIVTDFAPNAVVHLAAQMDVRASVRDPAHDVQVNVLGTVRVLQAAAKAGAHTVVFASSGGAIYGDAPRPTPESHPGAPMSPYGAAKACGEIYVDTFARAHSMRGVSLRFGNVYGPGQDALGEAGVVAIFAKALLAGVGPVLYGDGLQTRDYVYVADVAQAISQALVHPTAAGAFNIGTGIGTDLHTLLGALTQAIETPPQAAARPPVTLAAARAGEVLHSRLDIRRAAADLDWRPTTDLAQGLLHTVAAMRVAAAQAPTPERPNIPRIRDAAAALPRNPEAP